MKKRLSSAIVIAVLIAIVLTGCTGKTGSIIRRKITLENGNVYKYWSLGETNISVSNVDIGKASKEKIRSVLNDPIPEGTSNAPVRSAKDAAYQGATILDASYDQWTQEESFAVAYNKNADAWIVHGQLKDRLSYIPLGIVAFDASTGDVIAIALSDTDPD